MLVLEFKVTERALLTHADGLAPIDVQFTRQKCDGRIRLGFTADRAWNLTRYSHAGEYLGGPTPHGGDDPRDAPMVIGVSADEAAALLTGLRARRAQGEMTSEERAVGRRLAEALARTGKHRARSTP